MVIKHTLVAYLLQKLILGKLIQVFSAFCDNQTLMTFNVTVCYDMKNLSDGKCAIVSEAH